MSVKSLVAAGKAPNQTLRRTIQECLERGHDDVAAFSEDFLGIVLHPGQQKWLRRELDDGTLRPEAMESALACSNRWGKSHVAGVKLLHRAFYQIRNETYKYDQFHRIRPYRAINIAMSLDQAMLSWNYALSFASNSPRFKNFIVKSVGAPFPCIELSNAKKGQDRIVSEVWARSTAKKAKYLLGKSFNFCNYDEAAFDADGAEILNQVLRARLFDEGGELDMISSPNGKNWFYNFWLMGQGTDTHFYSRSGPVYENKNPYTGQYNFDYNAVKRSEKYMPEDHRLQNIEGKFADFKNVFPIPIIQGCYQDQEYTRLLPIRYGNTVEYVDTVDGYAATRQIPITGPTPRYVVGADLARKKDLTVVVVLRVGEGREAHQLVACDTLTKTTWERVYNLILKQSREYGNAPILVDSTGLGDVVLEELQKRGPELSIDGYNLAGAGKDKENLILRTLTAMQERRVLFPHIQDLVKQLTFYDWNDKRLQTDYVFGFCLAVELAERITTHETVSLEHPDSDLLVVQYGPYGPRIVGAKQHYDIKKHQGNPYHPVTNPWNDLDGDDELDLASYLV